MSIDAAGFSRLMGMDDEAALSAFEERRDIIVECCGVHGGRTFGDAGDSIMAEFGNPVEALLAAFDFQERISALNEAAPPSRRMPFRAGINTGDVIAHEGRLYGDDVNIAARIQEFAPHGGLTISETTWHHVKDKTAAEFTDLGVLSLKNIALPVRVFAAGRGPASPEGAAPASLPIGLLKHLSTSQGPPAIAVLPFRDGGERELAYLADGIADTDADADADTDLHAVANRDHHANAELHTDAIAHTDAHTNLCFTYTVAHTVAYTVSYTDILLRLLAVDIWEN